MRRILFFLFVLCTLGAMAQASGTRQERKARKLLTKGKAYPAIRVCSAMLGREVHPEFYALRAEGYNRVGEHTKAAHDARSGLQARPGDQEALLQLALAQRGQGTFDSAAVNFATVLDKAPSAEVRFQAALNDQGRRHYAEAVRRLDEALATDNLGGAAAARFHRLKGECLAVQDDSTAAVRELDTAVELDPDDPVNYNSRGVFAYAFRGKHQQAIAEYDRALKLNPNYSYAFNNRGWSWYQLGQKDKALADIERAKRRKVFNPYVYRNLGLIALDEGDSVRACAQFRQALAYGFTALYGDEMERMIAANCAGTKAGIAPAQAPNAPMDRREDRPAPRTNAP